MKHTGLLCLALLVSIMSVGCSKKENTTPQTPDHRATGAGIPSGGAATNRAKSDEEFVHDVALMNMAEIELSKIALRRAASPQVKVLAQLMINDHGAAGDKLK